MPVDDLLVQIQKLGLRFAANARGPTADDPTRYGPVWRSANGRPCVDGVESRLSTAARKRVAREQCGVVVVQPSSAPILPGKSLNGPKVVPYTRGPQESRLRLDSSCSCSPK